MARRRRAPMTQLARAGERTTILVGDGTQSDVVFRARTLAAQLAGTLEIETAQGRRNQPLADVNALDATDLTRLSVVPDSDTVITFVPPSRPSSPVWIAIGMVFLCAAVAWTGWDLIAG